MERTVPCVTRPCSLASTFPLTAHVSRRTPQSLIFVRSAFSRSRETQLSTNRFVTQRFSLCRCTQRKTKERNHHRRSESARRLRNQHRQHQSPLFRRSFRDVDISRQVHVSARLSVRHRRLDAIHRQEPLRRASEQHFASALPRREPEGLPAWPIHRGVGICRQRFNRHNQISRTTRSRHLREIQSPHRKGN